MNGDIFVWRIIFYVTALLASILTGLVCLLAMIDFVKVRLENVNGAIRFMTLDNFRHQIFLLVASLLLLMCTLFVVVPMVAATLSFITVGITIDAIFSMIRRPKMAQLVGEYMEAGVKGGRRKTDPPADSDVLRIETDGGEGW